MRAIRPSPRTSPSLSESMPLASSRCRRAETIELWNWVTVGVGHLRIPLTPTLPHQHVCARPRRTMRAREPARRVALSVPKFEPNGLSGVCGFRVAARWLRWAEESRSPSAKNDR